MNDAGKTITDFLYQNPQWLQEHAAEFGLKPKESKVLSFQEGKVSQLKSKMEHMAAQLEEILLDTQANQALSAKIFCLDRRLLAVNTVIQWLKAVSASLTEDFNLPNHKVCIVSQPVKNVRLPAEFVANQEIARAAHSLTRPQCGTVPAAAFLSLFAAMPGLASFLQLPLRFHDQTIAVVLIGHEDADHFRPDLSTESVSIMADNMAVSLARLLKLV